MGFFKKKEQNKQEAIAPRERNSMKNEKDPIASILAKEMIIKGEIFFKGKARFDGTVEGDIAGEYLILSATAKVIGNIEATTVVCHGTVHGNIVAEVVAAHATSSIHGILKSENLTVEPGASLQGEIHASSRKQIAQPLSQSKKNDKSAGTNIEGKK